MTCIEETQMFLMLMMTISKRIPSLLRGSVGICANSEVIFIVLVLYFLVPPTGVHANTITHVNPIKDQSKPWGKNTQEKNKIKIIFVFPRGRLAPISQSSQTQ